MSTLWVASFIGAPYVFIVALVLLIHYFASQERVPGRRPGIALTLLSAVIVGYAVWWMWLSWGSHYVSASGQVQGPYRPWQVIACALTAMAATAAVGCWSRWRGSGPIFAALGVSFGFCLAFASDVLPYDPTGQSAFGVLLLILGSIPGLGVVGGIVAAARTLAYARWA